jgi:N-acetylglucosamine-6-phosphate deacetylase
MIAGQVRLEFDHAMTELLLHNGRLVLETGIARGGVLIRDGRIASVFGEGQKPTGLSAEISIDLKGAPLTAGMIDIHIHGSAGVDVQSTDVDELARLAAFLLANGITGFLATFVPADDAEYRRAIETIARYLALEKSDQPNRDFPVRARLLGIHFEGPFVNHQRCGALKTQFFRTFNGDPETAGLFDGTGDDLDRFGIARFMTLAPEVEGGIALIRHLTSRGTRVSIGHSQAATEVLDQALAAGARHITHFPNALDPLHHRRPGAMGWGLVNREVTLDCIADFHHVDPLMLRLIYQSKGADRLALISDAIAPAGLGDGDYTVWGEAISVRNGRTSLTASEAGTIAGSVISMREALANMISLGVVLEDAIKMSTLIPAQAAGVSADYGSIAVGKHADLVAWSDDLNPIIRIVSGETERG